MKRMKFLRVNPVYLGLGVSLFLCLYGMKVSWARDLESAARSYTSALKNISQGVSLAGFLAGGIFLQIPGLAAFGKTVLMAAFLGATCAFGGPGLISLFRSVFGG